MKRQGLFKDPYKIDYALKITELHTHTVQVVSACSLHLPTLGTNRNLATVNAYDNQRLFGKSGDL
jgi:hypothetical protein